MSAGAENPRHTSYAMAGIRLYCGRTIETHWPPQRELHPRKGGLGPQSALCRARTPRPSAAYGTPEGLAAEPTVTPDVIQPWPPQKPTRAQLETPHRHPRRREPVLRDQQPASDRATSRPAMTPPPNGPDPPTCSPVRAGRSPAGGRGGGCCHHPGSRRRRPPRLFLSHQPRRMSLYHLRPYRQRSQTCGSWARHTVRYGSASAVERTRRGRWEFLSACTAHAEVGPPLSTECAWPAPRAEAGVLFWRTG